MQWRTNAFGINTLLGRADQQLLLVQADQTMQIAGVISHWLIDGKSVWWCPLGTTTKQSKAILLVPNVMPCHDTVVSSCILYINDWSTVHVSRC